MYRRIYDSLIVHTDAEKAHEAAMEAISLAGRTEVTRRALERTIGRLGDPVRNSRLLAFPRPIPGHLGLAAGMDKNAIAVLGMAALGFGFVEIGTVTATGQPGNEKPRSWRHPEVEGLRNRMGFNNDGAETVAARLRELRRTPAGRGIVVGANVGKTKVTPAEEAVEDYRASTRALARWADYMMINVSSPNTPGLRDLQQVTALAPIARAVRDEARRTSGRNLPVFVKIAPDLSSEDIEAVARMVVDEDLSGIAATNTTIDHDYGPGGLSGAPLRAKALPIVADLRRELGQGKIIIASGGIFSVDHAREYLEAGADLLQAFTGFVYQGAAWPGRINRALARA